MLHTLRAPVRRPDVFRSTDRSTIVRMGSYRQDEQALARSCSTRQGESTKDCPGLSTTLLERLRVVRRKSNLHRIPSAHPRWYEDVVRIVGQNTLDALLENAAPDEKIGTRKWLGRAKALHMPSCNRLWYVLTELGFTVPPPDDVVIDELDYRAITLSRELRSLLGEEDFLRRIESDSKQVLTFQARSRLNRSSASRKRPQ